MEAETKKNADDLLLTAIAERLGRGASLEYRPVPDRYVTKRDTEAGSG